MERVAGRVKKIDVEIKGQTTGEKSPRFICRRESECLSFFSLFFLFFERKMIDR